MIAFFDGLFVCLLIIQVIATLLLSIYALHEGTLLLLFWLKPKSKARNRRDMHLQAARTDWPTVTIQLPLYNERYVTERVIAAACAQDYPAARLQIQVLDDSTDDTRDIAAMAVAAAQTRGVNISHITRPARVGYKAGALHNGLCSASGEFIAIFDADFVPAPDFLQQVLPHFSAKCKMQSAMHTPDFSLSTLHFSLPIGFVQTRWTYLNRERDAVTRAQALMLDMHFVIEQPARSAAGLLMNFNGSGGVWRRACIDDAGGWQADTLTEDLDLSYRAGVCGWRGVYLADVTAPGELPASLLAFKRQQARWARGTAQCIRKLIPQVLCAPVSPLRKLAGVLHISGYVIHLFIMALVLVGPMVALMRHLALPSQVITLPAWFGFSNLVGALPLLLMCVAHQIQGRRWRDFLRDLPVAVMCGIGLSFSDAVAFVAGWLAPRDGEFVRTPKLGDSVDVFPVPNYILYVDWTLWAEIAIAIYSLLAFVALFLLGDGVAALPSLLYAMGFGGLALGQLTVNRQTG